MKLNSIIKGDSIEVLKTFPENSVDFIFADPPYFMQTEGELIRADGSKFDGVNDEWDKFDSFEHYDQFTKQWLYECKRVLKPNGTICVIGSFQNIFRIGYFIQNLGFWILNDLIWNKTNPVPNFAGTRFCNSHETMIWASKTKDSKFTFNYKTMKHLNNNKQEKSVWNISICNGNERLKDQNGKKIHSTQKPEELLYKILLATTKPNDIVLDPFFGTGTTGAVAKKIGRNFIGIEREDKYIKAAQNRIDNIKYEKNSIHELALEIKPPKVPMEKLVSSGLVKEGNVLYDKNKIPICSVVEDGKVCALGESERLSIHKMSAKFLNKENHNGWDFFYLYNDKNMFIMLNDLRYEYEKQNKKDVK
ncbi:DNA-methyltransferase [Mycoplasma seminis]|uniref:Methyltransferase n=1 Tax=Mycoplasma seminis TaxID=512749 RepID=A0ABY9HBZ1_9MOLU|nr:site-specific DNA-methyltransferase [Mycoplasma seminis]WLP85888.1 site-specific DNA-methyltransferase [Mycoplasma seminis]